MKAGDKVKCVKFHPCLLMKPYLTDGKVYEVITGKGDIDHFGDVMEGDDTFEVMTDDGSVIYCYMSDSSHAVWELVP